ncbi:MAG: type II toxin-antitoxin system prevent-host-death family antitoxin [Spirochaetales bacterium]|nr:type II toxin-antitoxin system prevent-host-death family antitoxin [Spirochaetales bacterium]
MQSISVAIAKDKLPLYLHLAESGETIEVTRHGKPVAIISSVNPAVETPSAFELAYHRFRMQLEADKEYTDAEWERIFDIPRPVHPGPRHPEDFE